MITDAAKLRKRYLLRIAGACDEKIYVGPEIVSLNISDSCNLSCKHCWSFAPGAPHHVKKTRFFPRDKFVKIVNECVDLKVDQVHVVGEGEPTLHPMFPEMMRHLEGQPLKVKLFTNATFPLEYCSDVIRGDHVVINLCAADRQRYRDLHGRDFFDQVVANIQRLVSLRDAGKPGFFIEVVNIVNARNIRQGPQMRNLASRLGVNAIYFKKMNVHGYNQEIALPEGKMSGAEEKRTPPACLNGWFYVIVKSDGHVSTCCRIGKMPLGNFSNWSLKELWRSESMMRVRRLGKYGHIQKRRKICQTCPYYEENMRRLLALARSEKNEKTVTP